MVGDALSAGVFRSIGRSAITYFYRCGHAQKKEVCQESKSDNPFNHADCLPEMRKDRVYKLVLKLDSCSYEMDAV